jgi:hypothetical protein
MLARRERSPINLYDLKTKQSLMRVIPNSIFFENVEQILSEGKSVELRCFGSSMQPYLRGDGSEIIIASPFSPDELIPGVIVLFLYQGKHLCHRIIMRIEDNLLIQGDGSVKQHELVTVSDVIGIIQTVIRPNKKPVSTQSKAAQRYWYFWFQLTPLRKYLLFAYRLGLKK